MRIRLLPTPEQVDITNLNVFISYRFADTERAETLAGVLRTIGFQATLIQPEPGKEPFSPEILEKQLFDRMDQCDRICVLASEKAIASKWVRYEIKEAVQLLGRIIFISDDKPVLPEQYLPKPGDTRTVISVKHSTVRLEKDTPSFRIELAKQIMYAPDEGWYDRKVPGLISKILRRDFRRESIMRKIARKGVLVDRRYQGKGIVDVLPIDWKETECREGDIECALRWYVRIRGHLPLEEAFGKDEVSIGRSGYAVPDDDYKRYGDLSRNERLEFLEFLVVTQESV